MNTNNIIAIVVSIAIATVISLYLVLRTNQPPSKWCYSYSIPDPSDPCTQIKDSVKCEIGTVAHFVSSGNISLSGKTNGKNLAPVDNNIHPSICAGSYSGSETTIALTGDFYIIAPCEKLTDNVFTNLGLSSRPGLPFSGNTIGDLTLIAKIFKDGSEINTTSPVFSLKQGNIITDFIGDSVIITENNYDYICMGNQAKCAVVISMKIEYNIQHPIDDENYKLVFYAKNHGVGMYDHNLSQMVNIGCLASPTAIFHSSDMIEAHKDHFTEQEVIAAIKENQNSKNQNLRQQEKNLKIIQGSIIDNCKNNYTNDQLQFYRCLDQSGCHVADHVAIINLPELCSNNLVVVDTITGDDTIFD